MGVFLVREPVDVFISLEKAKMLGSYRRTDTTEFRPSIDVESFLRWKWKQQNHYQMAHLLLSKARCPIVIFRYRKTFLEAPNPVDYIRRRMAEVGVALGENDPGSENFMSIQDRAPTRSDKVSNWNDFLSDLGKAKAMDSLDEYEIEGSRVLLTAQAEAERFLSFHLKRRLASAVYPFVSWSKGVLGSRSAGS